MYGKRSSLKIVCVTITGFFYLIYLDFSCLKIGNPLFLPLFKCFLVSELIEYPLK